MVLELPLRIVAPPFLARQKETATLRKKVSVDADIPNLFFGFPQPESGSPLVSSPASHAANRSEETNFYVWDDSNEKVCAQENDPKGGGSPGTLGCSLRCRTV